MENTDIIQRFDRRYRDADNDRTELDLIRGALETAAHTINEAAPDGREKSLAITKLEEAHQWAERAVLAADGPRS